MFIVTLWCVGLTIVAVEKKSLTNVNWFVCVCVCVCILVLVIWHSNDIFHPLYSRGADKSLAQPGRKQATATEDFEFHISCL
jgi:cytosine/uracil/thiamine/allantoin permease